MTTLIDIHRKLITRRNALTGLGASAVMLAGCDRLTESPSFSKLLEGAEKATQTGQRLVLTSTGPLAREYTQADITPNFKANGTVRPSTEAYQRLLLTEFSDWKLKVDGLVMNPFELSLEDIRALPSRSQVTRHDCVEGWSAIGQWKGVQLSAILQKAQLKDDARYVVFHCADNLTGSLDDSGLYYESIDLVDAFHPQTILAYEMNGKILPVEHGAPLRVRVERQLGYKMAKYIMRIEVVNSFAQIAAGKGGFWEDRGYEWYAGI
jgi:DMSO/TMAO reductase YedYZ molybdopterin-dependent catalytic subunit